MYLYLWSKLLFLWLLGTTYLYFLLFGSRILGFVKSVTALLCSDKRLEFRSKALPILFHYSFGIEISIKKAELRSKLISLFLCFSVMSQFSSCTQTLVFQEKISSGKATNISTCTQQLARDTHYLLNKYHFSVQCLCSWETNVTASLHAGQQIVQLTLHLTMPLHVNQLLCF